MGNIFFTWECSQLETIIRFCQTTAVQFIHLQTPDARPAGEPKVWYHVSVIVILIFDLLGVTIQPDELVSFFEGTLGPSSDNDEHPSSDLDGGCSSLDPDPTPSLTLASSDATGFGDSQPERLGVESQGLNRRKKMRLEHILKSDGIDTQSPDHELDVDFLVSLIRQRDRTIDSLRSQKRRLQQDLRRAKEKLAKNQEKHSKDLDARTSKTDFDIHRCTTKWEENGLKWSWITPQGQANVAVTLSERSLILCFLGMICIDVLVEYQLLVQKGNYCLSCFGVFVSLTDDTSDCVR